MARWTVDRPTKIDFDGVVALKANIVAGSVSILPTDDEPTLHVSDIEGHPLEVVHEAGMLTLTHKSGGLDGMLKWLQNTKGRVTVTITLPRACPVTLNLVTASAMVTGMSGRISIKTASGDVTLDGVTGTIDANTATGAVEAHGLSGAVTFNSLSGDLALARGTVDRLQAHSVSGKITTDVDLRDGGRVNANTVSGEITMRLPESISARITLNSVSGRVDAAFPGLTRQDRPMVHTVTGTVGDGTGHLAVNSVSGAITLLSRPPADALRGEAEG